MSSVTVTATVSGWFVSLLHVYVYVCGSTCVVHVCQFDRALWSGRQLVRSVCGLWQYVYVSVSVWFNVCGPCVDVTEHSGVEDGSSEVCVCVWSLAVCVCVVQRVWSMCVNLTEHSGVEDSSSEVCVCVVSSSVCVCGSTCVVRVCVNVTEHSGVEDGSSEVHGEPTAAWSVCHSETRCFVR